MKGWLVRSLKLWNDNITQVRTILKRELVMPSSLREMKTGSTKSFALTGVIFVGFLVVLAVFLSTSCPGVYCSKTGKLQSKHLPKPKNAASSKYSSAAVADSATTSPLNKAKTSEKNKNVTVEVQKEVTSKSNSSWKKGGEPIGDAEFETQDYRSYDPAPSLKEPPHKLTPNR